jgi:hypothetical protein
VDTGLYGGLAEEEMRGDLGVGAAVCDQAQDLELTVRDVGEVVGCAGGAGWAHDEAVM